MAQLVIWRDYDNYEILGLYKNLKQAREARLRFIELKMAEFKSQLEKACEVYESDKTEDGDAIWDEEDLEWFTESTQKEMKRYPDNVVILPMTYGDYHTSHEES